MLAEKFTDHGFIGTSATFWSLNVSTMMVKLIAVRGDVER